MPTQAEPKISSDIATLLPKQQLFVQEYLKDLNATQAYIRAGYSPKGADASACRLLHQPRVQAAIRQAMDESQARTRIDADYVVNSLRQVVDLSLAAALILDKQGQPTGEWSFNAAAANKALELLGKHLGMFDPKSGSEAKTDAKIVIYRIPDNERD